MFIFLLIMNSLISMFMIFFGGLWKNHPPAGINWVYGYRSSMSMKNKETWDFAHKHNAKVWRWVGRIWLIISTIIMLLFKKNYEITFIWITRIGIGVLILSMIPTEIALRKKFDKEGNRIGGE